MKYLSPVFWFNCISALIKFCVVYLSLGTLAFLLIVACEEVTVLIQMDWNFEQFLTYITERDPINFIEAVRSSLLADIPLAEVADKMLDDSGTFINIFLDFNDGEQLTFNAMLSTLFPDTVKIIIANFVIYIFARINTIISRFFSGFAFKLGLFVSMGIFGIAAFSVSATILKLIDLYVPSNYKVASYLVVVLLCFFMHSACLSSRGIGKIPVLHVIKHLGLNVIFGVVNSVLCWFVCFYLDGIYSYANYDMLIFRFIFFCIILAVEKAIA